MYCLSKIITISFTIASFSSYGWANPNNNLTQINTKTQAGSSSPLPDYDPSDALVVVMTNTFSGKRTGYGSVIGDGSLVVTAYHIAFESSELCLHTMPGIVTVISPYLGDLCNGRIIAADQELDVAVLEIPWRGHPSLELAPNEKLHKLDYGEFVSYMGGAATTETPPWGELITEKLPVKSVSCRRGIPIQIVLEGYGQLQDGWSGCPIISEKLLVGCFTTKFSVEPKIKLNVMPDESFYNSRRQDNAYGPAAGLIRKLIFDADKVENMRPSKTVMKQPKETQKATNHLLRAFSISAGDKISQEVIDQVEQFLNLRPKSALGTAYLAVCQEKAQKPDTETTYQRAIEYDKTNFYTRATYGQFLMNSGRMNGAREQFLQAKQLDPDTRMMDTMLVQILGSSGKSEEALAEIAQIKVRDQKNAYLLFFEGGIHVQKGETDKGIEFLKGAIKLWPENIVFRQGIVVAMEKTGAFEEAEKHLRDIILLAGDDPIAYYALAFFLSSHRPEARAEAIELAQRALNLSTQKGLDSTQIQNLLNKLIKK